MIIFLATGKTTITLKPTTATTSKYNFLIKDDDAFPCDTR